MIRRAAAVVTALLLAAGLTVIGTPAAEASGPTPPSHLAGVGTAKQLVVVEATGYGTTYATATMWRKASSGWRRIYGPWQVRIGYNGFAPPGQKREGDGRTPTGSYPFSFFFGVQPAPSGLHYSWRHAYSYDVWDDDSSSSRYNLWTDRRTQSAGRSPEPLAVSPSYNYAAVIAYNTARKPGLGSAIFFHVSRSRPTAGCVAMPQSELLTVLRWVSPSMSARIIMGTHAAIYR